MGLTLIFSFIISSIVTPLMILLGKRFNLLDKPGGLKGHKEPVPFLGGIGIFIALMLNKHLYVSPLILTSLIIIFLLGFIDDLKHLSPYTKLAVQFLVAGILVYSGIRTRLVFIPEWANIVLSILWIVGITNAFNIIDVMDGISGGVALIGSTTFMLLALKTGNLKIALFSGTLMAGILGFLPYNLPPARIFLGDTGSLVIGMVLSIISLEISYSIINPVAVLVPIFVLFFPIFDTLYVIFIRLARRKNPLKGSPDHFVLKLRKQGLGVPEIDAIVLLLTISLCEASYIVTGVGLKGAIVVLLVISAIFTLFGVILHKR